MHLLMTSYLSQRYRKNPPLQRNQNKYSGAVLWERLLMDKLKKSVIAFRSVSTDISHFTLTLLHPSVNAAILNVYFFATNKSFAERKHLISII